METKELRKDLECVAKIRSLDEGDSMIELLKRLDRVANEPSVPGRLQHYLSKRSYVKALAWIDEPEMPHQL